jgi:murein DD-endopeptidase MepM/ murein hydrolase activator NlpD
LQVAGAGKGAVIRVEPGMTLYSVARANNVPLGRLAKANGLRAPYTLAVGRKLVVPGKSRAVAPDMTVATRSAPVQKAPKLQAEATPAVERSTASGEYAVSSGDTLYSIGQKFGVSPFIIADANGLKKNSTLSVGQTLRIPGAKTEQVAVKTEEIAPVETNASQGEQAIGETTLEPVEPITKPSETKLTLATEPETQPQQKAEPMPSAGALTMRWPVTGKVISEFGSKPNGMKNEGINISVPEGTPIRAAEGGVIAYSGNELKGYGNLILIRHEGGFVTAYAHAKELSVKRGDTVKRGDVIGRVGQTGAVSTPQLHFEVRKGAAAMDPLKFIGKAAASN